MKYEIKLCSSRVCSGEQICYYEALDVKIAFTAVTTMPAPHCSVVFASADSPPLHRPRPAGTYQTQRKTTLLTSLFSLHPFYANLVVWSKVVHYVRDRVPFGAVPCFSDLLCHVIYQCYGIAFSYCF